MELTEEEKEEMAQLVTERVMLIMSHTIDMAWEGELKKFRKVGETDEHRFRRAYMMGLAAGVSDLFYAKIMNSKASMGL